MLILAILLSFGIWFGSLITFMVFREVTSGAVEGPEFWMPVLTRFAVNWYWLLITLLCLFSCAGLILSVCRVPLALSGAVGVAMPLIVGWFTLFCYSFDSFLGPVSMHHPQRFEFEAVLFSDHGFFSITFVLMVFMLGALVRDAMKQLREGNPD